MAKSNTKTITFTEEELVALNEIVSKYIVANNLIHSKGYMGMHKKIYSKLPSALDREIGEPRKIHCLI